MDESGSGRFPERRQAEPLGGKIDLGMVNWCAFVRCMGREGRIENEKPSAIADRGHCIADAV